MDNVARPPMSTSRWRGASLRFVLVKMFRDTYQQFSIVGYMYTHTMSRARLCPDSPQGGAAPACDLYWSTLASLLLRCLYLHLVNSCELQGSKEESSEPKEARYNGSHTDTSDVPEALGLVSYTDSLGANRYKIKITS